MATIATSIMSSVGCLVVIFWTRIPGHMITRTTGLDRCRAPEPEQLVAHRGDHRDEQDPARDHDQRRLAADEAEHEDRQQDHDHQELGAAARMGGRVLADVLGVERVVVLERVDRHVLGAVVLEHAR